MSGQLLPSALLLADSLFRNLAADEDVVGELKGVGTDQTDDDLKDFKTTNRK